MRTAVAVLVSEKPLTSPYFLTVFPAWIARSSVGAFGWLNVWLPRWAYLSYWLLGVTGLAGAALVWFRREVDRRIMLVLALTVVLALAVVVHINRTFDQPQGRYLFPGLPAFAALIAVGLEGLPGCRRWRRATAVGIAGGLAIANGVILTRTVMPAYYPPVTPVYPPDRSSSKVIELLSFAANLPARDFRFLQFELSGHAPLAVAEGSVYITQDGQGETAQREFRFAGVLTACPARLRSRSFASALGKSTSRSSGSTPSTVAWRPPFASTVSGSVGVSTAEGERI